MIGLPYNLSTKQDWLNAVEYVKATGDSKGEMRARLLELKNNVKMLVLVESAETKQSEKQTQANFISMDDPNCEKRRLGFTDAEINTLIGELG